MEVSVVVTMKDDEKGVKELVASLENQSKLPDELMVVDGGSAEDVVRRLNLLFKDKAWIKLIVAGKVNISQGRNIGIREAKNEIIATTDCGCTLHKDWLMRITEPFYSGKTEVVSGWYMPDNKTNFEEVLSSITVPTMRHMPDEEFIPSSRSLAFKKKAWATVGGYPEDLFTAEDTKFFWNLKKVDSTLKWLEKH
ncbi:glycosyltransferase [Paenibacillus sp. CC-CFT747]|nr:glycosyltransferase [Paenibacillus sp. CC-CFT747]